jgi:hypothetical protein
VRLALCKNSGLLGSALTAWNLFVGIQFVNLGSGEWGFWILDCGLIKLPISISRGRFNRLINPQFKIQNPKSPPPISHSPFPTSHSPLTIPDPGS